MGIALTKRYFHQIMLREPGKEVYALKLDISKYFYSIDHEILLKKVRKRMCDAKVLGVLRRIVDETDGDYISDLSNIINEKGRYYIHIYSVRKDGLLTSVKTHISFNVIVGGGNHE